MSNYICNRDQGCTTTENNTINIAKIIQMSKSLSAKHSASVCICYISGRDTFRSHDSTLSIQEGFHIVCKATFTSEITVEQMWRCTPGRVKTLVSSPVRGRANEWAHKGSTMENLTAQNLLLGGTAKRWCLSLWQRYCFSMDSPEAELG